MQSAHIIVGKKYIIIAKSLSLWKEERSASAHTSAQYILISVHTCTVPIYISQCPYTLCPIYNSQCPYIYYAQYIIASTHISAQYILVSAHICTVPIYNNQCPYMHSAHIY